MSRVPLAPSALRAGTVAAVLCALALSGCVVPEPVDLEGQAWTDVDAPTWFQRFDGCSLCTGQGPEHHVLVVYRDGSTLLVDYGYAGDELTFEPGLGPWHDEVGAVLAGGHVYRVFTGHAPEADRLRLADLHASLQDPGEPDYTGCDDCSGIRVRAFGPDIEAVLTGNFEPGDDWHQTLELLGELRTGLRRGTEAAADRSDSEAS